MQLNWEMRKEKCTLIELVVKMLENDSRIVRLETKALTIGTTERKLPSGTIDMLLYNKPTETGPEGGDLLKIPPSEM